LKKYIKVLAFLALILLTLLLNAQYRWTDVLSSPEGFPALQQALQENLIRAMLIYIGVTVTGCVALALPGLVFAVAAGALFGPLWGTIACSIATTLGACLAFIAGRYFLRDAVKPIVMRNRLIRRFLFEESGKNDLFLLMLTRLVPVFPYNVQNFAYGITDIGFRPYALYSFVFMLPGTAAYVIAAAGISDSRNRFAYLGTAAALLALVTVVSLMLKKRAMPKEKPEIRSGILLNSWNQFLAFSPLYAASSPAESVFWPGCAAMKLDSEILAQSYRALRQAVPGLGFSSWCCAKPTLAVGSQEQRQKREAELSAYFAANGIRRLYTLCPNCQATLTKRGDVTALTAWPLLAEYTQQHAIPTENFAAQYILHDPCATRTDNASQEAARAILSARGVAYAEFEHCGSSTRCCGRRDMLFLSDPKESQKLLRARLDGARGLPIVSYCESCVGAFRGEGHQSVHLLEILFGKPSRRSVMNRVSNARRKELYA